MATSGNDEGSASTRTNVTHLRPQGRDHWGLVPRPTIAAVVQQIAELFDPERIVLFGSYAYGRPHPHSDVDLLVVMETPMSESEQATRICQAIDYHFGLDLIVRTQEALKRRLALGDPFILELLGRGAVLYERPRG
ncbi:MAG: nucleotidyltransferase domain-containing protein [Dehalococcoidia bacterium]